MKSPVRYLSAALRDDYKGEVAAEPSPEAVQAAETRKAQAAAEVRQEDAREAEMERARRLRAGRMARIRELVADRSPTQRDADKRLFLARLSDDVERAEFQRLGWGSALSVSEMVAFWEEFVPGAFDGLEG